MGPAVKEREYFFHIWIYVQCVQRVCVCAGETRVARMGRVIESTNGGHPQCSSSYTAYAAVRTENKRGKSELYTEAIQDYYHIYIYIKYIA